MYAAMAIGNIRDPRAVEPLISLLDDGDKSVRSVATKAPGEIRDVRAVEQLIPLLRDKDSVMSREAAWALTKITGQNFGNDPYQWQDWLSEGL